MQVFKIKDLTHHRSWWAVTLRQGAGPRRQCCLPKFEIYTARALRLRFTGKRSTNLTGGAERRD